jgi:hypothetical protein
MASPSLRVSRIADGRSREGGRLEILIRKERSTMRSTRSLRPAFRFVPVLAALILAIPAVSPDYADLKVKPGQTIRILVREASSKTDLAGYFPEILLTLK